jgi:hypothetical protein
MQLFLTAEFVIGLLIGVALRATGDERRVLQLWRSNWR